MRSALGTALGIPGVRVPCVPAAFAGDREMRHVPLDGTAPGTSLGSLIPARYPGIRTPGAFQHLARAYFHSIPPKSTLRIRRI